MAATARLFPASPKPAGGPVTPGVRSPKIRFARAAKDARFRKILAQLQHSARKVGQHPSATRKADEAQAAAKAPLNEKDAGGRAYQVDDMKDAKVEKPGKGGFLAILRVEIDKLTPKTLDDADNFMKGGESEQVKHAVGANVTEQKQKASGPTEQATAGPPATGKVAAKDVTTMPPDPATVAPPVAGAEAMPAPKPQAEVAKTAADASASADQQLKDAQLTEIQLRKANDPRFSAVLTMRDKVKETAAAGPAKYRTGETQALNKAKAGATGDAHRGLHALVAVKNAATGKNKTRAQLAQEKDEAERQAVTDAITRMFGKTKDQVDAKLSTLETDAMAMFDAGADAALARMKNSANAQIDQFKHERYKGIRGKARWTIDLFRDTPSEIKDIIAHARERFTVEMDALAVRVAKLVDNRLAEAKAIITAGQVEIQQYVAGLRPNLRLVGEKAAVDIQSKFDELKQSVDDRAQDLAEKLAQKYKDASDSADKAAKEMEEANKGALRKLAEKVGEIVAALAQFGSRVLSLFKKAASVISDIVADPIGFLGNLLKAIKQGIAQFSDHIDTHIVQGFAIWLTGDLAKSGIEIPAGLPDPAAVLKLTLNVLGLSWTKIRPRIARKIGERGTAVLEKTMELLEKLFTGGPAALWAELEPLIGDIKGMVFDAMVEWVTTKVVTKAILKVASMFNPVGALIQAILMVYDVASWLFANYDKILDFIESVLDSIELIVKGDIGGAATHIEMALAGMIPILIGFLASFVGLSGIGDTMRRIIQKVQTPVGKAVDVVIDKVYSTARKLVGKLTGKGKKGEKPDGRTPAQKQADLDKAMVEVGTALDDEDADTASINKRLKEIKDKYNLVRLELVKDASTENSETDHVLGEVNPRKLSKPKKFVTGMTEVPVDFTHKKYDVNEYRRQLRMQQATIWRMTIEQWAKNRNAFKKRRDDPQGDGSGRDPKSAELQEEFRKAKKLGWIASRMAELQRLNPTWSLATARGLATRDWDKQAALHPLDQVAGGGPKPTMMGDLRVNSSIGSTWRTEVVKVEKGIKGISKAKRKIWNMNVRIRMDGLPV